MTEEEIKKLKQTVDYFSHWYDVIGEERVSILEKAVKELEATKQQVEEYKNGNFVQTVNQIIEGKDKRLEQAIDLIKKCMKVMEFHDCEYTDAYKEADQFIKENNNG